MPNQKKFQEIHISIEHCTDTYAKAQFYGERQIYTNTDPQNHA